MAKICGQEGVRDELGRFLSMSMWNSKNIHIKKKPSGKYLSMSTTKEDDVEMH